MSSWEVFSLHSSNRCGNSRNSGRCKMMTEQMDCSGWWIHIFTDIFSGQLVCSGWRLNNLEGTRDFEDFEYNSSECMLTYSLGPKWSTHFCSCFFFFFYSYKSLQQLQPLKTQLTSNKIWLEKQLLTLGLLTPPVKKKCNTQKVDFLKENL